MAVEAKRGCGFRAVGGLYLVTDGDGGWSCDRLPFAFLPCATCGEEPRFHRSLKAIQPHLLVGGEHVFDGLEPGAVCGCPDACPTCHPSSRGWMMWVGAEHYSPLDFKTEAEQMGVSRRIPALPHDFRIGTDWVYLAHQHAVPPAKRDDLAFGDGDARGSAAGLFYAFQPARLEKIVRESEAADELAMQRLREAGITPVPVPDNDPDHDPRER